LIHAYVGIGQVADMERGEIISYQFTLDEARQRNNKKAIKELELIGKPPYKDLRSAGIQRKWLAAFNGQVFKGTAIGMFMKNMSLRDIGFFGLSKWVRGIMFSLKHLEDQMNKENLIKNIPEISVPVFFCCGRRDYNVPFELSAEYLEVLRSPKKEIIWFEKSAHAAHFEEPELFQKFCSTRLKEVMD
jgi:pimeloyl-ACP methyl ester carboxylesterase